MKFVLVWDWPVRVGHWLMVLLFSGLIISGKSDVVDMQWHFYLGYGLSAVLLARIVYGFCGSYHVRFAHFLQTVRQSMHYAIDLIQGNSRDLLGHNPLGWLMVVLLLLLMGLQVISGLFYTDEVFLYGPLYDYASEVWLERFASLHQQLPDILLGLVALHVAAVLVHELCFKERIILAMLHGKKRTPMSRSVPVVSTPRWGIVISVGVSLLWLLWLYWLPSGAF